MVNIIVLQRQSKLTTAIAAISDAVDAMTDIPIRRWTAVGGKMSTDKPMPRSMMHVTNVPGKEISFLIIVK